MTTDDIYSRFYLKITDYQFLKFDENIASEMMLGWLKSASSKPYIRKLFNTFSLNDLTGSISYTIKNSSGSDDTDDDYIAEILAIGMVIEWLQPKVNSVTNISQMIGGKEEKFYAQSTHLGEIRKLLSELKTELKKDIRDFGYLYNSYINSEVQP